MSLIKLELPFSAYPEPAEWSMGKFCEVPKFILEDFFNQSVRLSTTNNNKNMIVIGGETTIVCYDVYNVMYLWVEKDISELDEAEVPNLVASTHGVVFEEDSKILIPIPFYSPDYFLHNNFFMLVRNIELETAATSGLSIDNNNAVYFRSDGALHDFIRNRAANSGSNDCGIDYADYDQYVNVNKTWLYFGKIFSSSVDNIYWVEYKGIDRFSVAAMPPVNRTSKVESLFELFFDRIYNQVYNLQKNVHSLLDPWEIDMTFIEYLASHYSMTLEQDLSDERKRQYVFNLINLLKRKGTYASLFIVFKSLFPDSLNNLSVYERWHERGLTGSPLLYFRDFNYLQSYSYEPSGCAGSGFYNTISQGGWDIPLNEMCHIFQQNEYRTKWVIPHKLNTQNPLIAVYDERLRAISPKSITNPENYLTILDFDSYVKGYCLMTYPQQTLSYETSANSWEFSHTLGQLTPVIQNYDTVDFSMVDLQTIAPQTTGSVILQSNTLPDEVMTVAVSGDYIYEQVEPAIEWEIDHTLDTTALVVDFYVTVPSTTWTLHHNLNTTNLIIQCFNNSYYEIRPDQVTIVDSNVIEITFESKQEGFALVKIADYTENVPSGTSYSINHNLDVFTPMIQAFNSDGEETAMNRVFIVDKDNVGIETWETGEYDFQVVNPSYVEQVSKSGTWNIRHEIGNRNLIVQAWVNDISQEWEIPHSFGHRNLFFQCFDGNDKIVNPIEARIYDDKVLFTFPSETKGYICLTEADETWVMGHGDLWTITHTLDHLRANDVIVQTMQVSGSYDVYVSPSATWLENSGNTINVSLTEPISGLAHIKVANYYSQHTSRTEWLINHYLDEDGLITKCFSESGGYWTEITPDEVEMISNDVTKVTFSSPTSGFVVFTIPDEVLMPVAKAAPESLRLTNEDNLSIDWYTAQRGFVVITEADAILKNFNKATPKSLKINDVDTITANFDRLLSGYAVLHDVGQLVYSAPLMMSPHYKVQLDISCEPFDDNWLLDEATMTQLIRTWEISKPVSRFSHYSILVSPIADWDYESDWFDNTTWHRMYSLGSTVNIYTKACVQTNTISPSSDYIYTNYAGGTLWDITHSLNTDNLSIQCYDENGFMVWPEDIQILSTSRVLITFNTEQQGSAMICKADFTETILTEEASGAWSIDHRLGERLVLAQHFYKNIVDVENEVRAYSTTHAVAYFNETTYDGLALGKETIIGGPPSTNTDIFTGTYNGSTWSVNHNLGTRAVMVAIFGSDYYQIIPDEVYLIDDENLSVTFSEEVSGYIIVKSVGGLMSQQGVIDSLNAGGYIKIGDGTNLTAYNPKITDDLKSARSQSTTPLTISEDSNYYYISGEVMFDNLAFDVTEIGLFTKEDKLVFYSMINAQLYKPSIVDFAVHYRISKISIVE